VPATHNMLTGVQTGSLGNEMGLVRQRAALFASDFDPAAASPMIRQFSKC